MALALLLTGEAFWPAAQLALVAHLPVMIIEGLVTLFIFQYFRKTQPALLAKLYA